MAIQFAYSVVGFHGSGIISYREALAAVFLEGQVCCPLSMSCDRHSNCPVPHPFTGPCIFRTQMDFPLPLNNRSPTMARPYHAPIARSGRRCRYRSFHCVSQNYFHLSGRLQSTPDADLILIVISTFADSLIYIYNRFIGLCQ